MLPYLLGISLAIWSIAGIFIWTGMCDDVRRWYKRGILLIISGPIVWLFKILLETLISLDRLHFLYERFEKWMKE